MASEDPLAAWQANFKRDVQTLSELMLLRTRRSDQKAREEMEPLFRSVDAKLSEMEAAKTVLERYVAAQTAQLARLEEFHRKVSLQTRRVAEIRASIPAELAATLGLNDDSPNVSGVGSTDTALSEAVDDDRVQGQEKGPRKGKENIDGEKVTVKKGLKKKPPVNNGKPTAKTKKKRAEEPVADDCETPSIRGIDQNELDAAPQYVKGRLTVAKIESVVSKLNQIVGKKYTLLAQPFRVLSSTDVTTRQEMQEAECPETEGKHFLTDAEIKTFGKYRLDATVKSVITILRHTGSLKEIRGKNRGRIFIIQ